MNREQLKTQFAPILDDVRSRACIADNFLDKEIYQLSLATLWANLVMNPEDLGFSEADLEPAYDVLSEDVIDVLGPQSELKTCFEFLNSKPGERAMQQARLNQTHKDMLLYFASMMLDPEGHRRWTDDIRNQTRT